MMTIKFALTTMIILIAVFILVLLYIRVIKLKKEIKLMILIKETLYYVGDKVSKTDNMEEVYKILLSAAIELIPSAEKGSILILEDDDKFHFKALQGYTEDLKKLTLEKHEAYLYKINNFKETAIVFNPIEFDRKVVDRSKIEKLGNYEAFGMNCTLSSPIYIEGKLMGLINIDSVGHGNRFTKDDVELMNHIKNELQLALKNSFIQDRLRYMANHDVLTGLYSRRYFRSLFSKELDSIKKYNKKCCLVQIDLDDFKKINDTLGHGQGDRALKIFAQVLRENIRKTDIYARASGDEFIILFKEAEECDVILKMQELRNKLSEEEICGIKIDFSYGICEVNPKEDITEDEILSKADIEMYEDKKKKGIRRIQMVL